jgi:hypothetical protein
VVGWSSTEKLFFNEKMIRGNGDKKKVKRSQLAEEKEGKMIKEGGE